MALTPGDVQAVRFRTALRGYHTGEVDAFLDRIAGELARRHGVDSAAPESAAPGQPGDATSGPPRPLPGESPEEAALRVLLLAQRTADQVVADARLAAERILDEARRSADEVRAEAQARLDEVGREVRERRAEGVAALEADRERLAAEVAQLQAFEREYRLRLRAHLQSQLREIDGGEGALGRPEE